MKLPWKRKSSLIPGEPKRGFTSVETPGDRVALTPKYAPSYSEIYRSQPSVRVVVDLLARTAGNVPLKSYRRSGDERAPLDRDHPLPRLLRQPNTVTTGPEFIRDALTDRLTFGNAFCLIVRDTAGTPTSLVRLVPPRVSIVSDSDTEPLRYRVQFSAGPREFAAADVIHLRAYDPDNLRMGASPLEAARALLSEEFNAGRYRDAFWDNAARYSNVIERPLDAPQWKPEARERFLEKWRERGSGVAVGGTGMLEEGMRLHELTLTSGDVASYAESRRLSLEYACLLFGVLPGIVTNDSRNLQEILRSSLGRDALGSYLGEMDARLNADLVPQMPDSVGLFVNFDLLGRLEGDPIVQSQSAERAVGGPWRTPNEQRALENRPPVDGGDALYQPKAAPPGA